MATVGRPAHAPDELEHEHELIVDGGEHVYSLTLDEAEEEEEEPGVQVHVMGLGNQTKGLTEISLAIEKVEWSEVTLALSSSSSQPMY